MVRRAFEALERAFDSYWQNPRSISAALEAGDWTEWSEALDYVHPEVEWQTVFLGETFRGRHEAARVWDDFLSWAEDHRPALEKAEDLGGDRVFAVVTPAGKGKDSPARMDARFYDVLTIKDGLIARLEEYTTRSEALGDNVETLRAF